MNTHPHRSSIEMAFDLFEAQQQLVTEVAEQKPADVIIEKRNATLTQPVVDSPIVLEDLFSLEEIQCLQDQFALATGVASLITYPDGTPLTAPSNFTYLCSEIIRKNERGCSNCVKSDAAIGSYHPEGPIVQHCLSGGLWEAGASITVDGKPVANWLIGQVRDESQTEEHMRSYARSIGADESSFMSAFREVPVMSPDHFEQIARALFSFANQLSTTASQNIQQARYISERKAAEEALRRSQEQFKLIHEHAPIGILLANCTGEILEVNPAALKILGSPSIEGTKGINLLLFPLLIEVGISAAFQRCLESGQAGFGEYPYVTRWGKAVQIQLRYVPILGDHDQVILVHIIIEDITERKRAEDAFEEESIQRRVLFEQSPDGILIVDPETARFVDFNTAAHSQLGYSREEFARLSIIDLEAMESAEAVHTRIRDVVHEGRRDFDTLQRTKQGEIRNVHVTAQTITVGSKLVYYCVWRDITERKRTEDALKESEDKYRTMIEHSNDLIWTLDNNGCFTFFNDIVTKTTGLTLAEWTGKSFVPLILPEDLPMITDVFEKNMNGESCSYNLRFKKTDENILTISVNTSPIYISGKIQGVVSFGRDITGHQRLEQQLLQSQKLEGVGTLAGGIAHDFNNLLAMVLGSAELLQRQLSDQPELRKYVDRIIEASERGATISRQLLIFARPDQVELRRISISHIIVEIRDMLKHFLPKTIAIETMMDEENGLIMGDSGQIHQALLNLALNAGDAMANTGTLTIREFLVPPEFMHHRFSTESPFSYIAVSVSDTGVGMTEATVAKIFDPFFTTKEKGKGTGLGLPMVHGIVKNHNGFIDVASAPGAGTTFTLFFQASACDDQGTIAGAVQSIAKQS